MAKNIDLNDLIYTKDEALDILGDLLPDSQQGLFEGSAPAKVTKPRPKWRLDGFTIIHRHFACKTCGKIHEHYNPLILLSESYVDHDGRVLKSKKSSRPEVLRHQDIDYNTLDITQTTERMPDVVFCDWCAKGYEHTGDDFRKLVHDAFLKQVEEDKKREYNDDIATAARDKKAALTRAEEAEARLMQLIEDYDANSNSIAGDEYEAD